MKKMNENYNNLTVGNLMKTDWFNQFDKYQPEQRWEIVCGLEKKIDISVYAKKKFNWKQMREIRLGLERNLDVSIYANSDFTWRQMEQIREGLEANVDVSLYANPELSDITMFFEKEKLIKKKITS